METATVPVQDTLPPLRDELEAAKADIDLYGCCRFVGGVSDAELDAARARLDEQAAGEEENGCAWHDSGATAETYRQGPNQRIWNLINKGEVFRRLAVNAAMQALLRHILGKDLILSSFIANRGGSLGSLGGLHGDQMFAPAETPFALVANCLLMLDDFTQENGATSIVPGTRDLRRWPQHFEAVDRRVPVVGPAGTMFLFDGRVWHGTGCNMTERPRRALLAYACLPWVRQQENLTLSVEPSVLENMSDELKTLLGFKVWGTLGGIEGTMHGTLNERPTRYVTELRP